MTVTVMVRTPKELKRIVDANPFPDVDLSRLYVAFLSQTPTAAGVERLAAFDAGREEFKVAGKPSTCTTPTVPAGPDSRSSAAVESPPPCGTGDGQQAHRAVHSVAHRRLRVTNPSEACVVNQGGAD